MKKIKIALFFVGCIACGSGLAGRTAPAQNNRGLTGFEAATSFAARKTELDSCSSRNVAENIRFFFQCVKSKLTNYVMTGQGGILKWDKSKVFAMNNGAIKVGSVPITAGNQALYNQWKNLYQQYVSLSLEEIALIDNMMDITIDDSDNPEVVEEDEKAIDKLSQQEQVVNTKIANIETQWSEFKGNSRIPTGLQPSTAYPTYPDPLSPIFLTVSKKSGVWLVNEQFYADVRTLLDQNPYAHLQLLKYYMLETPARFRKRTMVQNNFIQADKAFKVSLLCGDPNSVEGLLLNIAAIAAPPLPYLPLRACQMSGQRIATSDGSALNATGATPTGTSYAF